MKMKQFISLLTTVAVLNSSLHSLQANEADYCPPQPCPEECYPAEYYPAECYPDDCSGYAFENCRTAPNISPTLALGAVVLVAVIAVVATNNKKRKSGKSGHFEGNGVSLHAHNS